MDKNLKLLIQIIIICQLMPSALLLDCHICHEGYECRRVNCDEAKRCVILKGKTIGKLLEYHADCDEPGFCNDSVALKNMKARFYLQSLACDSFCSTNLCNLPPRRQHAEQLLAMPLVVILGYFLMIFF